MVMRRVIQVLGGFCIGIGLLSMCTNFSESVTGLMGPDERMKDGEGMPGFMKEQAKAQYRSMQSGLLRTYMAVEGAVSSVMAVLLIVAGIGLLRLKRWARRLGVVWACYAIAGSLLYIVVLNYYLLPDILAASPQQVPRWAEVVMMFFILLVLWAFPAALLTLLRLPVSGRVFEAAATEAAAPPPISPSIPSSASPAERVSESAPPPTEPPTQAPPPAEHTWRDDPWNDPEAT